MKQKANKTTTGASRKVAKKAATRKDSLGRVIRPAQTAGVKKPVVGAGDNEADLVCPVYLGEIGRACWFEQRDELQAKKILDHRDAKALELFAGAYQTYCLNLADCEKNGYRLAGVSDRGKPTTRTTPFSPPSGPAQRLAQGPTPKANS